MALSLQLQAGRSERRSRESGSRARRGWQAAPIQGQLKALFAFAGEARQHEHRGSRDMGWHVGRAAPEGARCRPMWAARADASVLDEERERRRDARSAPRSVRCTSEVAMGPGCVRQGKWARGEMKRYGDEDFASPAQGTGLRARATRGGRAEEDRPPAAAGGTASAAEESIRVKSRSLIVATPRPIREPDRGDEILMIACSDGYSTNAPYPGSSAERAQEPPAQSVAACRRGHPGVAAPYRCRSKQGQRFRNARSGLGSR